MLTPLAFLLSTARNCKQISDILALVLGLALYPLVAKLQHRRRYPDLGHVGRHDRLWRALVAGARMSGFIGDWHALLILVIAGFCPTRSGGWLGLWFGGGVDEGSEVLVWVRAVATAILAGVIAQILVHPPGALAGVPDWLRYGAVVAGFVGVPCDETLDFCRRRLR